MAGMIGRVRGRGKVALLAVLLGMPLRAVLAQGGSTGGTGTAAGVDRPDQGAFRTYGRLRHAPGARARNAVLVLGGPDAVRLLAHGLLGPGQPLDTALTFVIVPGGASGPAGSPAGASAGAVMRQFRLVTESLRVDHLQVIIGVAAGCAEAGEWSQRRPGMAEAVMAVKCADGTPVGTGPDGVRGASWRDSLADLMARLLSERVE